MSFLKILILQIRNNEVQNLESSLQSLSDTIDKIDAESAKKLIIILLKEGIKYDRRKCVELLIKYFAIKYYPDNLEEIVNESATGSILDIPDEDILDKVIKMLFSLIENPTTETDLYKYCFVLLEVNFADILMEVILIPDYSSVGYLINAISILGEPNIEELEHYQQLSKDHENYLLVDFFKTKLSRINNYQIIPDYMYNFLLPDYLPTEEDAEEIIRKILSDLQAEEDKIEDSIDKISDEELTLVLTSGIDVIYFDENEKKRVRDEVLTQVKSLTKQQKINKIKPFLINSRIEKLKENIIIFRILGPIQLIPGISYEDDDIYKHCMFTCDYYDWDEESEDYNYWFTESCDYCAKKIRRKVHAVREPQFDGGWRGCFCSWKCVQDNYNELIEKQPGMNEMIKVFMNRMNTIGIQDQLPDDIIEEMKQIEKRRELRENNEVDSYLSQIPEDDLELFEQVQEFQIEQDDNYEEENNIKLEDLIEEHYLYGKIRIDQELNVQKIISEKEKVIPISPTIHNTMIIPPDSDTLNKLSIQDAYLRSSDLIPEIQLNE